MRPKSVVLQSLKKLKVLVKKLFLKKKKLFQLIFVDTIFKTVRRNFFLNK